MVSGGQSGRRAAAGEAGAADFPERERATGDDVSAAGARQLPKGLSFCRAPFAGRAMARARPTERHELASAADPSRSLGSVALEPCV